MRIGTLTLHAGFNEGAILQSLALHKALSELRPGAEVEIIDHRHPQLMERAYGPADNDRKKALQTSYDTELPLSPRRFYSSDRKPTFKYVDSRYDAVVFGSDEIWKIAFQRRLKGLLRLQTDPYAPAFPNVFWPDSSVRARKVSYAATVGEKTDWGTFSDRLRRQIAESLDGFSAIGVRDERTRAFVLWADPSLEDVIDWTPDPTFIADLTREAPEDAVREMLVRCGVDFDRPRALIIAKAHEIYTEAIAILRKRGIQTVAVSDENPYVDLDLTSAPIGPLAWAGLARHFDLCLSERMHGTIFSILNRCPTICLDRRRPTQGFPTKNRALLNKLGLESRYASVNEPDGRKRLLDLCSDGHDLSYDLDKLSERLSSFRATGRGFLDNQLQG